MQSQNRFFDDLARVASGAVGALSGVREEFEAVKAMAAKAREEQESLRLQVEALEARLGATVPAEGGEGSGP
jgi:regulator of replication initiation timing